MRLSNIYVDAIKSEINYFSISKPGQQVKFGDYVFGDDNVFGQKRQSQRLVSAKLKVKDFTKKSTFFNFQP